MNERISYEWRERVGPAITIYVFNRKISFCFCHRLEERSFKFRGYTFPLCSRCTGLILGIFFTMMLFLILGPQNPLIGITLMIPFLVDSLTQFTKKRESNNILRFSSGTLFSIGFFNLLWVIL